ncbi:MAG: hypothetical protein ABIH25_04205 [Candidatus Woesearchaeota archaeon]
MATKILPKFEGKPIIEIPKEYIKADFLTRDFGKRALEEYQGRVRTDYQGNRALSILIYQDGVVKRSNPFAVVLMNSVLEQEQIRTATAADFGKILRTDALPLKGQYEDIALVLRNMKDPNSYLAGNLQKQLKARGRIQYPAMVNLTDLELVNDQDNPHGLSFKLKEDAEVIHAKVLAKENNSKRFSETDENGLPIFGNIGDGSRTLYTRNSGLSRLSLDWDLNLYSNWDDFDFSSLGGRVVVVRDAVASDDFKADLITKLAEQYTVRYKALEAERADIQRRIEGLGQ